MGGTGRLESSSCSDKPNIKNDSKEAKRQRNVNRRRQIYSYGRNMSTGRVRISSFRGYV